MSPTTTLTLSDLPRAVCGRPLASVGVRGGCYSVSYSPTKGAGAGRLDLMSVRFSGECPRPRESTAVRLIRPDDLLGHLGVQGRPHVSTTVVSTVLAAGPCIRDP
jgi:hypothetical protein